MSAGGFQTIWVDYRWEPHSGCPGCAEVGGNCPARLDLIRKGRDPNLIVQSSPSEWKRPYQFKNGAWVLAGAETEFFADGAKYWLDDAFDMMRELSWLQWIILTKQLPNAMKYLPREPIPNLWVGTSAGTQEALDERVPMLYELPVAGYVISAQPLLEPLEMSRYLLKPNLKLVVVGCEMGGKNARPCDIEWIKDIHAACACYGVSSFVTRYRTPGGLIINAPTYNGRGSHEPSRPSFVPWSMRSGPQH